MSELAPLAEWLRCLEKLAGHIAEFHALRDRPYTRRERLEVLEQEMGWFLLRVVE